MSHHWLHWLHHANHEVQHKNSKFGAVVMIVIGFCFAPLLIGIPIMIYGFYKLCS